MERCTAPQLESARKPASTPDPATAGGEAAKDVYECRICGYKALGVKSFSQHLHAAHPVTSFRESGLLRSERCDPQEEERGGGAGDGETPCLNGELSSPSPVKEKPITPEGSNFASVQTTDDINETSSSTKAQEQEERMEVPPVPKATQNSSPVLPQEKSPSSSGSKQTCPKRHAVSSGTSTHNQPNLVCLPLVSEGLKLIWVRSEQIHELDEVSDLVEAFNAFPYPTSQEASALARKCALPPDRVKAWFMMQRVRYGISWGDDDIQETRRKLWHIQKKSVAEECVEVNNKEHELQNGLGQERKSLNDMQQVFKQPPVAQAHTEQRNHTPKPGHTFPQHTTNDQYHFDVSQNNSTSQSNTHVQQLLSSHSVYNNGLEPMSQVSQMNPQFHSGGRNLPSHNTAVQVFDTYGQSPYMTVNDQQTATQYHSGPHPFPESFQSFPGKKSKAQLMALRRSFVRKPWPSDTEVQRLQRSTGLNRREIRKWFADSRYQLRKNGRAWLVKLAHNNRSLQQGQENFQSQIENDILPGGSFYSNIDVNNTEARFEVDVGVDDDEGAVNQSNETIQEINDEGALDDSRGSIQQYSADCSTSPPPPSPSSSFQHGRVEPNVRLRKKTREQLEVLRQSFLLCQWPTSNDYLILQQKTGLTRTEIIQWYGDTRYHVKHNQMRWMTSEERKRIIAVITQQQKRGGKSARGKFMLEGMGSRLGSEDSTFINGGGGGESAAWNELFSGSTPVLPQGEL